MDFFHHKMLISTLFCCLGIPFNLYKFFFYLITIKVIKCYITICKTSNLHIANIIYISCIIKYSWYIRANIAVAITDTKYHWTVFSCYIYFIWIFLEHNCKCVRTTNPDHSMINGIYWSMLILLIIIINKLNSNFCIS